MTTVGFFFFIRWHLTQWQAKVNSTGRKKSWLRSAAGRERAGPSTEHNFLFKRKKKQNMGGRLGG
jgi:hypothetical protein